jgi:hypothetical protein
MLTNFRNLVLSSAAVALCTTTAFAATQTRVNVPFNFVAENHAYDAGSYNVEVDLQRSLLKLTSVSKPSQTMLWIVGPGAADPMHPKVALRFDVIGQDRILNTVQSGSVITPNLDRKPKQQVERVTTLGE